MIMTFLITNLIGAAIGAGLIGLLVVGCHIEAYLHERSMKR